MLSKKYSALDFFQCVEKGGSLDSLLTGAIWYENDVDDGTTRQATFEVFTYFSKRHYQHTNMGGKRVYK